jgi:hypothetical protein
VKNSFKRPDKVLYSFYVVKSHSYVRFCRWFLALRRLNLLAHSQILCSVRLNGLCCPLDCLESCISATHVFWLMEELAIFLLFSTLL